MSNLTLSKKFEEQKFKIAEELKLDKGLIDAVAGQVHGVGMSREEMIAFFEKKLKQPRHPKGQKRLFRNHSVNFYEYLLLLLRGISQKTFDMVVEKTKRSI